ncbi:lipocalin-like domain-containing protein [Aquimarina rubra]|uniref:Lipocalin family protein n=1 Tax=Aquimarina rubra TaxID=1920033 RepID=A0ABW5LFQ7_9FLAO
MKKLIFLFAISLSIVVSSCGDDDDGVNQDLLIGSWKLSQEFENGVQITSDPCDLEDVITFKADGTFEDTYFEDNGSGTCVEVTDDINMGAWENTGGNVYSITFDGQTNTEEISFSGNTFSVEYSDTFDGQTTEYRDVYTRI